MIPSFWPSVYKDIDSSGDTKLLIYYMLLLDKLPASEKTTYLASNKPYPKNREEELRYAAGIFHNKQLPEELKMHILNSVSLNYLFNAKKVAKLKAIAEKRHPEELKIKIKKYPNTLI